MARVDVKAAAGATVSVKLKLSPTYYSESHNRTSAATLVLKQQAVTRRVTVTN